jgi:hypothetical protein
MTPKMAFVERRQRRLLNDVCLVCQTFFRERYEPLSFDMPYATYYVVYLSMFAPVHRSIILEFKAYTNNDNGVNDGRRGVNGFGSDPNPYKG